MITRRTFVGATMGTAMASFLWPPTLGAKSVGAKRLLLVVMRGATDGLAMVPPIGDPQFASIRGQWLEAGPAPRKISSDFALAPQLSTIAGMYEAGDVLPVHAVATAYRERSHFDAQNLLETGGTKPYALRDGWLNRLLGILEGTPSHGLAIAPTIPAALQGSQPVTSYAPNAIPDAEEDFLTRIASLYPDDSRLQQAWEAGIAVKPLPVTSR